MPPPPGRIDVHGHLLPGVDDGCKSTDESLRCAQALVAAGYTHAFCTPHVWPNLPENDPWRITTRTTQLQTKLAEAGVPLTLLPGGELNLLWLWPQLRETEKDKIPTYNMAGKFVLFDFWGETMNECLVNLDPALDRLFDLGLIPIFAHPERISACHNDPTSITHFIKRGVKLQLNTWCLTDPPTSKTYQIAERLLKEGHYFLAGTDLHDPMSMPPRIRGLELIEKLTNTAELTRLTITNPATLI